MNISIIDLDKDLESVKKVANDAFSVTPDSSLEEWFSFDEMVKTINENRGICLKAEDENGMHGIIYAQQESPINGQESLEKYVIVLTAVLPQTAGKGVGTELLKSLESEVAKRNVKKLFVFTNKDDTQVINFYHKNGYEDAGWIKDYQYGKGNSAVFLLKWID